MPDLFHEDLNPLLIVLHLAGQGHVDLRQLYALLIHLGGGWGVEAGVDTELFAYDGRE